jgi:hypothetical protein
LQPPGQLDGLFAVSSLAADIEAVLDQKRSERVACERVVIDDQDAGCHGSLIGTGTSAE